VPTKEPVPGASVALSNHEGQPCNGDVVKLLLDTCNQTSLETSSLQAFLSKTTARAAAAAAAADVRRRGPAFVCSILLRHFRITHVFIVGRIASVGRVAQPSLHLKFSNALLTA